MVVFSAVGCRGVERGVTIVAVAHRDDLPTCLEKNDGVRFSEATEGALRGLTKGVRSFAHSLSAFVWVRGAARSSDGSSRAHTTAFPHATERSRQLILELLTMGKTLLEDDGIVLIIEDVGDRAVILLPLITATVDCIQLEVNADHEAREQSKRGVWSCHESL